MITAMLFSTLIGRNDVSPQCNSALIAHTLRQVESSKGPRHYMDTKVQDLIQAADFEVLAAKAYGRAEQSSSRCDAFRRAKMYFDSAFKSKPGNSSDVAQLDASKSHVRSLVSALKGCGTPK